MVIRQKGFAAALFALVLGGTVAICQTAFAGMNLHDGEWEVTTTMQGGQPQKNTDCITKDDIIHREKDEDGCKSDIKVVGSTFSMHQVCNREGGSKEDLQMEETYAGDSVKGTIHLKVTDPTGKPMSFAGTISGRRIGACKKEDQ